MDRLNYLFEEKPGKVPVILYQTTTYIRAPECPMAPDISRRSAGQHLHTAFLPTLKFSIKSLIDRNILYLPFWSYQILVRYIKMANFSGPSVDFLTAGKAIEWGYPAGASIVDLVPEDMRGVIHSHWKSFPPVNSLQIFYSSMCMHKWKILFRSKNRLTRCGKYITCHLTGTFGI